MCSPTLETELDSKRVHRISMEYEKKSATPRSPIAQRKVQPPATPRESKRMGPEQPDVEVSSKMKPIKIFGERNDFASFVLDTDEWTEFQIKGSKRNGRLHCELDRQQR